MLGSYQPGAQPPTPPGTGEQVPAVLGPQGPTQQRRLAQLQPLPYTSTWRVSLQEWVASRAGCWERHGGEQEDCPHPEPPLCPGAQLQGLIYLIGWHL